MSAHGATIIKIATGDEIDELMGRLPELSEEHVVIEVQDDTGVLLTAAEYSGLLAAAQAAGVSIALSTQDNLRRDLARMLGWTVLHVEPEPDPGSKEPAEPVVDDEVTTKLTAEEDVVGNTTADLATYKPRIMRNGNSIATNGRGSSQTGTVVIPKADIERSLRARPATQGAGARRTHRHGHTGRVPLVERPAKAAEYAPSRRPIRWLLALGAPLLVLVVLGGLLFYVLPTATVTLVPLEQPIESDLVYGVANPGSTYDITIQPEALSNTVSFHKTIPTTGERFEPDGSAAGSVLITNPMTSVVTIPAGTALTGSNGIAYYTQEDVNIPAADPFGALSFGSASVDVVAGIAGPDGNVEAGTIVGQLASGVFYNNREAVTGGTNLRIAVVAEADVAALREEALADLAARAEPEFQKTVNDGLELVPNSLQISEPVIDVSHEAGADATEISVTASQSVSAQAYDPSTLHDQARAEVGRRLASQVGSEAIILGDSIRIGEPTPRADGISYDVHAQGIVRSVVTEDTRRDLANQLAGKAESDANAMLDNVDGVASYQVKLEPGWLLDRMPELVSRIDVVIANNSEQEPGP